MAYRKFRADDLFDGERFLGPGRVLITADDGRIQEIVPAADAGEGVEILTGWLTPGWINAHCHLELSHLKGRVPEKTGLVDFVFSVVSGRREGPEIIAAAIAQAEAEMIKSGIVAVGDISNTGDSLPQKALGRLNYYNFIEVAGWMPAAAPARFAAATEWQEKLVGITNDPAHTVLVPHAPYSVSEPLWNLLSPGFAGHTVSIHNQETPGEDAFFLGGDSDLARMYAMMKMDSSHFSPPGTTSLSDTLPRLAAAGKLLLVHNTFTSAQDFRMAAAYDNLFFCLCPNANLYIENKLPDLPALLAAGGKPVFGTDSLASNHGLSILGEIKTLHRHFPGIPSADLLRWGTANGAAALGFDGQLGSFQSGKKPGVLLIESPQQDMLGAGATCRRLI